VDDVELRLDDDSESKLNGRVLCSTLPLNDRDRGGCTKALVWKAQSANALA